MIGITTKIYFSNNGINDLEKLLQDKNVFFIIDDILRNQKSFSTLKSYPNVFWFNATKSEPKTEDVDYLKKKIIDEMILPEIIVGIGGGSTMDLAKATAILLNNPMDAEYYQGWGKNINKGVSCWTVPTLNGTGAEITPIAVLKGPVKKLGINHPFVAPELTIIDSALSQEANIDVRFLTVFDSFAHNFEIFNSKTSSLFARNSAKLGLDICNEFFDSNLKDNSPRNAELASIASLYGSFATAGGRVGACHAISYGLSNVLKIKHSAAVFLSMQLLEDFYDENFSNIYACIKRNMIQAPSIEDLKFSDIDLSQMVKTAKNMNLLWESHFGEKYKDIVDDEFLTNIYKRKLRR